MSPFIDVLVVCHLILSVAFLRDDNAGFSVHQFVTQPVFIEGLVAEKSLKLHIFDHSSHSKQVMALTRKKCKPNQVCQGIDKSYGFGA